jgi:hypothetical protein
MRFPPANQPGVLQPLCPSPHSAFLGSVPWCQVELLLEKQERAGWLEECDLAVPRTQH